MQRRRVLKTFSCMKGTGTKLAGSALLRIWPRASQIIGHVPDTAIH